MTIYDRDACRRDLEQIKKLYINKRNTPEIRGLLVAAMNTVFTKYRARGFAYDIRCEYINPNNKSSKLEFRFLDQVSGQYVTSDQIDQQLMAIGWIEK